MALNLTRPAKVSDGCWSENHEFLNPNAWNPGTSRPVPSASRWGVLNAPTKSTTKHGRDFSPLKGVQGLNTTEWEVPVEVPPHGLVPVAVPGCNTTQKLTAL